MTRKFLLPFAFAGAMIGVLLPSTAFAQGYGGYGYSDDHYYGSDDGLDLYDGYGQTPYDDYGQGSYDGYARNYYDDGAGSYDRDRWSPRCEDRDDCGDGYRNDRDDPEQDADDDNDD